MPAARRRTAARRGRGGLSRWLWRLAAALLLLWALQLAWLLWLALASGRADADAPDADAADASDRDGDEAALEDSDVAGDEALLDDEDGGGQGAGGPAVAPREDSGADAAAPAIEEWRGAPPLAQALRDAGLLGAWPRRPDWHPVSRDSAKAWFDAIDLDAALARRPPPKHSHDLAELMAAVRETTREVRAARLALFGTLASESFSAAFDAALAVSDGAEPEDSDLSADDSADGVPGTSQDSQHASRAMAPRRATPAECARWSARARHEALHPIFSVANTVPAAHAQLWREVLSDDGGLNLREAGSPGASPDAARLLVLPWTAGAAFMSLEQAAARKLEYHVVFSRLTLAPDRRWPLTSRRQDQLAALQQYMTQFSCSLESRAVRPPAAAVTADPDGCAALFASYADNDEADVPWLVKTFGAVTCQADGSGCLEAPASTLVVRGLGALRRQFGICKTRQDMAPVLIERAVLQPMLLHSRRFKLHALVLVTDTDPWRAYFHKGFATLASPLARTEASDGFAGAAVHDAAQLARETTNLLLQSDLNSHQDSEVPLWDHGRLETHWDSYGHCAGGACARLWRRVETIARMLVEATAAFPSAAGTARQDAVDGFQLFRVSFWVTDAMVPVLHRGSSDLSMLLQDFGQSGKQARGKFAEVLKGALRLALRVEDNAPASADAGGGWKLLVDHGAERCGSISRPAFDPCKAIEPLDLFMSSGQSSSGTEGGTDEDASGDDDRQGEDKAVADDEEEEEEEDVQDDDSPGANSAASRPRRGGGGSGSSAILARSSERVLGHGEKLKSPKSAMPTARRRAERASLREL